MKNRIFKDSPFFDEAGQMPVDKDVFAFRMRQGDDFACSCSGTGIVHDANSEKLNLFATSSTATTRGCLSDHSGGGIAEQRIG
jgi:hypothetical protein